MIEYKFILRTVDQNLICRAYTYGSVYRYEEMRHLFKVFAEMYHHDETKYFKDKQLIYFTRRVMEHDK